MYDCDYEYDIMGVLRLLKYLHLYEPERAKRVVAGETEFTAERLLDFLYESTDAVVEDFYGEYNNFEGSEVIYVYDQVFDEFISLTVRCNRMDCFSQEAARRKFEDIVVFYLADRNYGINDVLVHFEDGSPQIQMLFFEGNCEPQGIALVLTDLMHYLHRENARMRKMLEERSTKIVSLPQDTFEEAA